MNKLLGQLDRLGVLPMNSVDGLVRLTAFAVQFRLGPPSAVAEIDRAVLTERVASFVQAAREACVEANK